MTALGMLLLAVIIVNARRPVRASNREPVPLVALPGLEYTAAFSPDGSQIAYFWEHPERARRGIYLQRPGSFSPAPLVIAGTVRSPDFVYSPAWSPDGSTIAYLRRTEGLETSLCLIALASGHERRLAVVARGTVFRANNHHLAWSSDGKWVFSPMANVDATPRGLYRISAKSGKAYLIAEGPIIAPTLSPDGHWLAYLRSGMDGLLEVHQQRLTPQLEPGGPPGILHHGSNIISGLAWGPTGSELMLCISDQPVYYSPLNSQIYRLPARPGASIEPIGVRDCSTIAVSRPGGQGRSMLVYGSPANAGVQLRIASLRALEHSMPFASSSRMDVYPSFSPDGSQVAFMSTRSGDNEIWVARRDGSEVRRMTNGSRVGGRPSWSPDAARLLFHGTIGAGSSWTHEIWTLNIPEGVSTRLPLNGHAAWDPLWSPDGDWIFYSVGQQVWRARPDGSGRALVAQSLNAFRPLIISPDGQTLYFTRAGRPYALWSMPSHGGAPELVVDGLHMTTFAITKRYIYYKLSSDSCLYQLPLAGGPVRRVGPMPGVEGPPLTRGIAGFTVSPDDSEIIFALSGSVESDLQIVRDFK